MRYDTIVVGAGPAGSAGAICLARAGASVALVDRESFPRDKLCGGFVSGESLSLLERVGLTGRPPAGLFALIDRFAITTPSGRSVGCSLPRLSGKEMAWGVSRGVLDAWLLESAAAAGAAVFTGLEADGLIFDDASKSRRAAGVRFRRVRRAAPTAGGGAVARSDIELRAPVVIAADGRHSRIARLLESGGARDRALASSRPSRLFGFQAHFEAPEAATATVEIIFFRGGYVGLQPVGDGLTNLCGLVDLARASVQPVSPDSLLAAVIRDSRAVRNRLMRATRASAWQAVAGLRFGPRRPARRGVLFVGDAAGTIEPFTGEGIAMALGSGAIAARCAADFLKARGDPGTLEESYIAAWRGAFLGRLRWCRLLSSLAARRPILETAAAVMSRSDQLARRLVRLTRTDGRHMRLTS